MRRCLEGEKICCPEGYLTGEWKALSKSLVMWGGSKPLAHFAFVHITQQKCVPPGRREAVHLGPEELALTKSDGHS